GGRGLGGGGGDGAARRRQALRGVRSLGRLLRETLELCRCLLCCCGDLLRVTLALRRCALGGSDRRDDVALARFEEPQDRGGIPRTGRLGPPPGETLRPPPIPFRVARSIRAGALGFGLRGTLECLGERAAGRLQLRAGALVGSSKCRRQETRGGGDEYQDTAKGMHTRWPPVAARGESRIARCGMTAL